MSSAKPEKTPSLIEEEKLLQALLGRGWLTSEEVHEFRHQRAGTRPSADQVGRPSQAVLEGQPPHEGQDGLGRPSHDAGKPSHEAGAKEVIAQLVKAGYLTASQGQRADKELESLLD